VVQKQQLKLICPACQGSGWLCDEHPALPWDHDGCEGAGIACNCNAFALVPHKEIFVESDVEDESTL